MYKILLNAINRKKNTIKIITNYIVRYITLQSSNAFNYFYPTMLQSKHSGAQRTHVFSI